MATRCAVAGDSKARELLRAQLARVFRPRCEVQCGLAWHPEMTGEELARSKLKISPAKTSARIESSRGGRPARDPRRRAAQVASRPRALKPSLKGTTQTAWPAAWAQSAMARRRGSPRSPRLRARRACSLRGPGRAPTKPASRGGELRRPSGQLNLAVGRPARDRRAYLAARARGPSHEGRAVASARPHGRPGALGARNRRRSAVSGPRARPSRPPAARAARESGRRGP